MEGEKGTRGRAKIAALVTWSSGQWCSQPVCGDGEAAGTYKVLKFYNTSLEDMNWNSNRGSANIFTAQSD